MPPILLMKRTLDDLEDLDDFDDFDGSEDEVELVEPQAKRLRDRSPIAKEESSGEKNVQTEEKYIADRVVELMMPQLEGCDATVYHATVPKTVEAGTLASFKQ